MEDESDDYASHQPRGSSRLKLGNPVQAPGVFRSLWRRGGASRGAVVVWLIAIVIGLPIGVLIGVVGRASPGGRQTLDWTIAGMVGLAISLCVLGGYLGYRGTEGFPVGWKDDGQPVDSSPIS